MRLLILTHDYPPQMFGGIGSFANNLANALSKKGVGVVVLAGCPPRPLKTGVIAARTTVNKNLEVIRVPRMDFPPSRIWYQLMNLNKIRDLVADFDIIHSQDQSAFPIICLCKKNRPEIPWVVTVHSNPVPELYYSIRSVASLESSVGDVFTNLVGFPLSDLAIRTESKLADALVPVSEELRRQIRDQYRVAEKKLFTIHNGVNVAELESEARMNQLRNLQRQGQHIVCRTTLLVQRDTAPAKVSLLPECQVHQLSAQDFRRRAAQTQNIFPSLKIPS